MKATPFNEKTIAEFHAKQGRGVGMWGDHVLLMTAKGARSGDAITTPLVYGRDGDHYVIVASKGGAPKHPTWFGNPLAALTISRRRARYRSASPQPMPVKVTLDCEFG